MRNIKVAIYADAFSHLLETMAYWLADNNTIDVLIVTSAQNQLHEHRWCLNRLRNFDGGQIKIKYIGESPEATDWIFSTNKYRELLFDSKFNKWRHLSNNLCVLTTYSDGINDKIERFVLSWPIRMIATSVGFLGVDRKNVNSDLLKITFVLNPSVHPKFIAEPSLRYNMFEKTCGNNLRRAIKYGFIGNKNPDQRKKILETVISQLRRMPNIVWIREDDVFDDVENEAVTIYWHEYGDDGAISDLSGENYIKCLDNTVFCICPEGWSKWTHRVVEALMRGAIPILEDEGCYNMALSDMENCIAVKNGDWEEAVVRANTISADKLDQMRAAIRQIRDAYIMPSVAAKKLRMEIGLE